MSCDLRYGCCDRHVSVKGPIQLHGLRGSSLDALRDIRIAQTINTARLVLAEIAVFCIDTSGYGDCRKESKQRPQLMLDDERVMVAAAGGGKHNDFSIQITWSEQIEEVLEQTGVRRLVNRSADHDDRGVPQTRIGLR